MIAIINHTNEGNIRSVNLFPNNEKGQAAALALGNLLIRNHYEDLREEEIEPPLASALTTFQKTKEWRGFSNAVTLKETTLGIIGTGNGKARIQHEADDLPTYITDDPNGESKPLEVGPTDIVLGEGIPWKDRLELAKISALFLQSR